MDKKTLQDFFEKFWPKIDTNITSDEITNILSPFFKDLWYDIREYADFADDDYDDYDNEILSETDKIINRIYELTLDFDIFCVSPHFLHLLAEVNLENFTNYLCKMERSDYGVNLQTVLSNSLDIILKDYEWHKKEGFEREFRRGEINFVKGVAKLESFLDFLINNENFTPIFLINTGEITSNILKRKNHTSSGFDENKAQKVLDQLFESMMNEFNDFKQYNCEIYPYRDEKEEIIAPFKKIYGNFISESFLQINPSDFLDSYSKYLEMFTEINPDLIHKFADKILNLCKQEKYPESCLMGYIERIFTLFFDKIDEDEYEMYEGDWKDHYFSKGESNLVHSLLNSDINVNLEIMKIKHLIMAEMLVPGSVRSAFLKIKSNCIVDGVLNKNSLINSIEPYLLKISNEIYRKMEVHEQSEIYRYMYGDFEELLYEPESEIVQAILKINPPYELFDDYYELLDVVAIEDPDIISRYISFLENRYKEDKKQLFSMLESILYNVVGNDSIETYNSYKYLWIPRREIYLESIFDLNPPAEFFNNPDFAPFLDEIIASDYKKRNQIEDSKDYRINGAKNRWTY